MCCVVLPKIFLKISVVMMMNVTIKTIFSGWEVSDWAAAAHLAETG